MKELPFRSLELFGNSKKPHSLVEFSVAKKSLLRGIMVAMYIVGQERRLVDPPSQVVAGVRTVTTNMDGRDALPRMSRPFAFKANHKRHQSTKEKPC